MIKMQKLVYFFIAIVVLLFVEVNLSNAIEYTGTIINEKIFQKKIVHIFLKEHPRKIFIMRVQNYTNEMAKIISKM